jgi:hypothetical protein
LIEIPIREDYEGSGMEVSIGVSFNALYCGGIVLLEVDSHLIFTEGQSERGPRPRWIETFE